MVLLTDTFDGCQWIWTRDYRWIPAYLYQPNDQVRVKSLDRTRIYCNLALNCEPEDFSMGIGDEYYVLANLTRKGFVGYLLSNGVFVSESDLEHVGHR